MDPMPLYPGEAQIAVAVLGPKRAKQWRSIAKFLEEKDGLPRIDKQMGGSVLAGCRILFPTAQQHALVAPKARRQSHNDRANAGRP
ncbi:hypothetical protein [Bradyrhizobium sp. USDA 10063]